MKITRLELREIFLYGKAKDYEEFLGLVRNMDLDKSVIDKEIEYWKQQKEGLK